MMNKITDRFVRSCLPEIHEDDCKFDRGHLLIVSGSYGMAGACIMCAKAALRTGVGYVTLFIPASIYGIVTLAVPEAVCVIYREDDRNDIREKALRALKRADAVVLGPGLGKMRDLVCPCIIENCTKKLLMDADGLNYFSEHGDLLPVSPDTVITPHVGEAGRLLMTSHTEIEKDRERAVTLLSEKINGTALLKGHETLVYKTGDDFYVNTTGNAGMARAGSGDVLSGVIGSLMAQGESGFQAAVSGAFLHGLAGDLARSEKGIRSMLPTDMIEKLPEVIRLVSEDHLGKE